MSDADPFTLEIIQNSLQSISDEMFAAFRRTALSSTPTKAGIPAPDEARLPSASVIPVPMSSTS